jgi:hypothetical protein
MNELDFVNDKSYISQAALYAFHEKGPAGYEAYRAKVFERSRAMDIGSAIHAFVLQPDKTMVASVPDANRHTKAGRELVKDFEEANKGMICLRKEDLAQAKLLADLIKQNVTFSEDDVLEHRCFGSINGLTCKAAPDIVNEKYVADIKTSGQTFHEWLEFTSEKSLFQLAFYAEVMNLDAECEGFILWVSTKSNVFNFVKFEAFRMQGKREVVRMAADKFKEYINGINRN